MTWLIGLLCRIGWHRDIGLSTPDGWGVKCLDCGRERLFIRY